MHSNAKTIFEIASLSNEAMNRALPSKIKSAFKKSGIYLYNWLIFKDYDFLMTYVTDHSAENEKNSTVA